MTRGQLAKIVASVAGFTKGPAIHGNQTFTDVTSAHTFYIFIEELAGRGIISGYACGGPGEPCDAENRPYFRVGASTTRGQLAKIVVNTFLPNWGVAPWFLPCPHSCGWPLLVVAARGSESWAVSSNGYP